MQFQTNTVAILQSLTEKNILWGDAWACQGTEQLSREPMWEREGWINGSGESFRLF